MFSVVVKSYKLIWKRDISQVRAQLEILNRKESAKHWSPFIQGEGGIFFWEGDANIHNHIYYWGQIFRKKISVAIGNSRNISATKEIKPLHFFTIRVKTYTSGWKCKKSIIYWHIPSWSWSVKILSYNNFTILILDRTAKYLNCWC